MSAGMAGLIEAAIERDDWVRARRMLLSELRKRPNDVWYLDRLSLTYYEQRKYKKALEVADRAYALAPNDPLVLWDRAGALDMVGRDRESIVLLRKILRKGLHDVAYGEGGEGLRWARSLINDTRYHLGLCYAQVGKRKVAVRYLREHLRNRGPSTPSIYPARLVKKKLREFEERRRDKPIRSRVR